MSREIRSFVPCYVETQRELPRDLSNADLTQELDDLASSTTVGGLR